MPMERNTRMNVYLKAWKLLLERLEQKTSWGKEALKRLMLQCLLDAGEEVNETNRDRVG